MSHAYGQVLKDAEVRGWFEYNGTVDCVTSRIRPTSDEVYDHWRSHDPATCTCGQPSEPVQLYTTYGDGFWWLGSACFTCMAITGGFEPTDITDGHPVPDYHFPW